MLKVLISENSQDVCTRGLIRLIAKIKTTTTTKIIIIIIIIIAFVNYDLYCTAI